MDDSFQAPSPVGQVSETTGAKVQTTSGKIWQGELYHWGGFDSYADLCLGASFLFFFPLRVATSRWNHPSFGDKTRRCAGGGAQGIQG